MREYGIWKEILSAINADNDLDKGNIVERIKEKLSLESLKEYCEWKDTNFDVGHLFKVTDGNNIDDHTLFNLAIKSNCTNVVNVLISIGPDINKVYQHKRAPLLLAIESGNLEILRVLIDKGKTIGKVFKYTKPPLLILAIIDHHLEIAKVLIDGGVDVDEPTEDGHTPLMLAAEVGYVEIIQALIDKGADINKGDRVGFVALHPAIRTNEIAACQCIVSHIAKLEVAGLHINQANLQLKNKLINRAQPGHNRTIANSYEASLRKCKEDVEKLAKEDKSLYEFLKESNINKLVSIWEANENISSKFNDERDTDIKERYPEYAHILIHKANEVKKEIFLYNNKPLINILLTKCGHDIKSMTFTRIKAFFEIYKNDIVVDFLKIEKSLIEFVDFKDVKKRHVPRLELQAFVKAIKQSRRLDNPNVEQHLATGYHVLSE